jgi:2-oxoglutarate dehydrogenase E1 component
MRADFSQFFGPNAGYVLEQYEQYKQDPASVDPEFRAWFDKHGAPPAFAPSTANPVSYSNAPHLKGVDNEHAIAAARLIRYIREIGHLKAHIDPLGKVHAGDPNLELGYHELTETDLQALPASILRSPLSEGLDNLHQGVQALRELYSGQSGYESDHIQIYEERKWFHDSIETRRFYYGFTPQRKREILERLTEAETFERFLHTTFVGQKRFSLEGCDVLLPMLDSIIRNAAAAGTKEVVIGMAHRGRLNVLAHILGKPYHNILSEFLLAHRQSKSLVRDAHGWTGDVKYHLGARRAYIDSGIEQMPITLAPNPSHLEFVNPVIAGRARAVQDVRHERGMPERDRMASLAIIIHGDAAFPGQGVVAETLNMSGLEGYSIGGTIHIILNNQIGFSTDPSDSRTTLYASDLAKGFEIPIVHVNADEVESCVAAARMSLAYRNEFHKDFLVDLVGYRRWGHNEGDEPTFTQPTMYDVISKHPTVRQRFAEQMIHDGIITQAEVDGMIAKVRAKLDEAKHLAETSPVITQRPELPPPGIARRTQTAVSEEKLREFNEQLLRVPDDFSINPKLARLFDKRRTAFEQPGAIDWAHAEALAFASLIAEGVPIRMTGQDSQRGTFSNRHLVLHDVENGRVHAPIQHLPQAKASFAVYNSPLSENAVLGFEYGYSSHVPDSLVLWEAQFGDFANGAQVIIDQFIVSGGKKWGFQPSLVLLLPHGYEGQGPEHSSARLERFLQLAADDNIRVANCTSAAQYFHLLRRQAALRNIDPRPLILMTPKSLLRHPRAGSSLDELTSGRFYRVIDDASTHNHKEQVTRMVLCSGKVYVDLLGSITPSDVPSVAIVRIEELYSFPAEELRAIIESYSNLHEVVWLQEEPKNMGAWSYVAPRIKALLHHDVVFGYVGRDESASPAEGALADHQDEQERIIQQAVYATINNQTVVIA